MNSEAAKISGKSKIYEFGKYRLEAEKLLLFKENQVVPLAPKAVEVLLALVESGGQVISKEEVLARVWANTFVEEANLTHHISALRKALGEDKNGRKFIETIPRRGYRFIAPVNEISSGTIEISVSERNLTHIVEEEIETSGLSEVESPFAKPSSDDLFLPTESQTQTLSTVEKKQNNNFARPFFNLKIITVLTLSAIVCFLVIYFLFWRKPTKVNSIAVLPFKILATDSTDDYLKFGMADSLITKLSGIKQITVRPTSSILRYADSKQDSITAGKELNVDAVLEGTVQRNKERFKVSIQLIKTSDGAVIWAETFDESSANIFNLQDSISEKIVTAISLNLTGDERKSLAKRYTDNTEAYQFYLQGRFYWYKWSLEGFHKAIEYFQKAIEKDPNYAIAYAGLADAYGASGMMSSPKEAYLKAKEATLKALELDNSLAEAHTNLGMLKMFYEWDRPSAHEQLLYALKLNPNNPLVYDCYSIYLINGGQADEAIFYAKRAQELDPLSPYMNGDLGMAYFYARQYDTAVVHLNKSLELDPNYIDSLEYLAEIHLVKGEYAQAVALWEKVLVISGKSQAADDISQAFAASGYKAAIEKRIEQLKEEAKQSYVSPLDIAKNYARLGDKPQAIEWLKKALEERSPLLVRVKVEPRWDSFHADTEFQELLQKINPEP